MSLPAPRARFVVAAGAIIGLGAWLPALVAGGPLYSRPDPAHPFVLANVAAVGLVLSLAEGKWRRAAAGVSLTLGLWLALYGSLCALRWRDVVLSRERAEMSQAESQAYWETRVVTMPKRVEPRLRALVRADLEEMVERVRVEHDQFMRNSARAARAWRDTFALSLAGAVLCAGAAARQLGTRTGISCLMQLHCRRHIWT